MKSFIKKTASPFFLSAQASQTLTYHILEEIFIKNSMDFQSKEYLLTACSSVLILYLTYESSQIYIDLGGPGTSYMPIHLSRRFGGIAAFSCNFSLGCYFLMSTLLLAQNYYRRHKLYHQFHISIVSRKQLVQFMLAALLALLSGTVMALIASNSESVYNQILTGLVNIVLSYCGCAALLESGNYLIKKLRRESEACFSSQESKQQPRTRVKAQNDSFFSDPMTYKKHMQHVDRCLQQIPNHDNRWNKLNTLTGYLSYLGDTYQTLPSPLHTMPSSSPGKKEHLPTLIKFLLHASVQVADKISLYGYWEDTLQSTQRVFNLDSEAAFSLALLIFTPFLMLSAKITYNTTNNFIELPKAALNSLTSFMKQPNWPDNLATTALINCFGFFLAAFGYFLAFTSTNTTLELNAKHGLNTPWSVAASLITVSAFNGFAFLEITLLSTRLLKEYLFFSRKKRETLRKHRQVSSLFCDQSSKLTIRKSYFELSTTPRPPTKFSLSTTTGSTEGSMSTVVVMAAYH